MEYVGQNGQIELLDDRLVIRRKGIGSFITHGFAGEKSILYSSITAVQFKPAGVLVVGYIQFSIRGGLEGVGGVQDATYDENTVVYGASRQREFDELRQLVEARIAQSRQQVAAPATASTADEIAKLAALRDRGVLTDEEFQQQKRKLLGL
jgi:Short C-terminal domain/Domain of unknown function (DUF4429)